MIEILHQNCAVAFPRACKIAERMLCILWLYFHQCKY